MEAADYAVLSALYDELSELEGPARAARLAALREAGHPLAARLTRMLADLHGPRTDQLLPRAPRLQAARSAGQRIGPWRLLSPLGSGGMAEVWLAVRDDGGLKREVALKLPFIAPGTSGSTRAQRFARERDILAALRHPHIAALLDAGVEPDGQAWLALERVDGLRITQWCDEHRAPLRQRIELFRQVLMAVQHAHAQLVIHRDIKPANVLVSAEGEVRLLDFGIAKLLGDDLQPVDDTELTQQAGRPLTPRYASPEQLRGEPLSTASDVYSLGVLLHELLTGRLPYTVAHGGAAELERAIVEGDVPVPSRTAPDAAAAAARATTPKALQKAVAPELDAVLLRALARQAADRYRSVDALLEDIERWQRGVPVRARTPSAWFRTRRFVGRHPVGVGTGVAVALGLLALSVTATWYGIQAREQSQRATLSRDFLLEILGRAESSQHRGAEISAREMLAWGRQRAAAMAATPAQRADLLGDIAHAQVELSDYAGAATTFGELTSVLRQLGRGSASLLASLQRSEMFLRMGDMAAMAAALAEIGAAMSRDAGPEVQAQWARMQGAYTLLVGEAKAAAAHDGLAAHEAARAWPVHDERRILIRLQQARSSAAAGQSDKALALLDALLNDVISAPGVSPKQFANIEYVHASIQISLGRYGSVAARTALALDRCERDIGKTWETCGSLRRMRLHALMRTGDIALALELADPIRTDLTMAVSPYRRDEALFYLARLLAAGGPVDLGKSPWPEVEAVARGDAQPQRLPHMTAQAQQLMAEAMLRRGQPELARSWVEAARQQLANSTEPLAQQMLRTEVLAGAVHWLSGRPSEALRKWQQAQVSAEQSLGPQHAQVALYALNLSHALIVTGDSPGAQAVLDRLLPVLLEKLGAEAPNYQRAAAWRRNPEAAGPATALGLVL